MKGAVKVGGRRKKGDFRDTRNWCDTLTLKATVEGDQFILAAIARVLFGYDKSALAESIADRLAKLAATCERDHQGAAPAGE